MKSHLLLTTIAAVVLVGCGEVEESLPIVETKPVDSIVEAEKAKPPTAKAPDISIHKAAEDGNIKAVKQHLAAGADVNAKDKRGFTPLHMVADIGIVELLIAEGADAKAESDRGATPLHGAAFSGHAEIAELLIAAGADVNVEGGWGGITPLEAAEDYPEIADLLRKHGGKTKKELEAEGK